MPSTRETGILKVAAIRKVKGGDTIPVWREGEDFQAGGGREGRARGCGATEGGPAKEAAGEGAD